MKKGIAAGVLGVSVLVCALLIVASRYQHTSSKRLPDRYPDVIAQVHSAVDQDQDGLDDQVDILQGALAYIATEPQYKSQYYSAGYPDDGYGVCTDVVAFALRQAGYDLMALLEQDIQKDPAAYAIEQPDASIDFRRVRNLKVYFARWAVSLTTDVSHIEAWQGGDIVIFQNHIGIVSDRRNERGVPYVLHHASPWQRTYEEDILEKREDIVGHYRMGGRVDGQRDKT